MVNSNLNLVKKYQYFKEKVSVAPTFYKILFQCNLKLNLCFNTYRNAVKNSLL